MGTKENGEESSNNGKEIECDYEVAKHSAPPQGGSQSQTTENGKAKKGSRVPQKSSRKQSVEKISRPTRSASERQESAKFQFKSSNNNKKRPEKLPISLSDHKVENGKVSVRISSESSEGIDERIVEEKHIEEVKGIDILEEVPNCDHSIGTDNETVDTEDNSLDEEKVNLCQKMEEMEFRIDKLEEELREVAALEISLYSIVPEHGSSAHKVHTPARRLSRLYIHACKHWARDKRATIARNTVSGLVLIAKSCGNDVPRLTFWLSNTVVLREIITGAFGNISHSSIMKKIGESNGLTDRNGGNSSIKWKSSPSSKSSKKAGLLQFVDDWQETNTYTSALEKIESWIFSRIVESVWWQTLTPHMQSSVNDSCKRKANGKLMGTLLDDQQQGAFSIELWKNAFLDAFSRLCPVRAEGHECGCLPILARMVMEQCVSRLDVAMFNAILRESASEIPTDPVSDPIVDPKVLPIPAGDLSFGSGAQLKNSIGNWSRWLSDLFGMDVDDTVDDSLVNNDDGEKWGGASGSKCFGLLNSLSDLLMLPKDMLLDRSIKKEVCPLIGPPLITRILCNFTPDEFCPDPVPGAVLEELNSEALLNRHLSGTDALTTFPFSASAVVYCSPSASDVARKVADAGGKADFERSASMIQRKGYTSEDDLDDMDSPLVSIIDNKTPNGITKSNAHANVRFELLREVWSV